MFQIKFAELILFLEKIMCRAHTYHQPRLKEPPHTRPRKVQQFLGFAETPSGGKSVTWLAEKPTHFWMIYAFTS